MPSTGSALGPTSRLPCTCLLYTSESYGWAGKILRVNLTTGEITTQDDEKYHKYIGGMGMAYRIMYEEAPMELDPYDEKALVIFGRCV